MKSITKQKPIAKVIGKDGNVFITLAICSEALEDAGMQKESDEMNSKVFEADSYEQALGIMRQYCDFK